MPKLGDMAEHTVFFVFFLFLFIVGAMLMSKYVVAPFIRPLSGSAGDALQAA